MTRAAKAALVVSLALWQPWFAVPLLWAAYWRELREQWPHRYPKSDRWWVGWVAANLMAAFAPWLLLALLAIRELVQWSKRRRKARAAEYRAPMPAGEK